MHIDKTIKYFLWGLVLSIVVIFILFWNIGHDFSKQVESGQLDSISGEGLGMLGILLYFYFFYYLIFFIIWLIILNVIKNRASYCWKKIQLIVIFIFSVIPTLFIIFFLLMASPNPFKQYTKVKRLEHEIENGNLIRYSSDSIKVYEATIVNDKIIGKEIERYETGEIKSVQNYKDGVLDGECIYYYRNGNKSESRFYKLGNSAEIKTWYENGKMRYFYNPDSLYRYRWWDNGQLQELYYNGYLNSYWEKDGTQTLFQGSGRITIWDSNIPDKKYSETIYNHAVIVKETTWYKNGKINHQREFIILNKQDSKKINFNNCEFRGYKETRYYEDGKVHRLKYYTTNECKNNNGESYIEFEWTKNGVLINN